MISMLGITGELWIVVSCRPEVNIRHSWWDAPPGDQLADLIEVEPILNQHLSHQLDLGHQRRNQSE